MEKSYKDPEDTDRPVPTPIIIFGGFGCGGHAGGRVGPFPDPEDEGKDKEFARKPIEFGSGLPIWPPSGGNLSLEKSI